MNAQALAKAIVQDIEAGTEGQIDLVVGTYISGEYWDRLIALADFDGVPEPFTIQKEVEAPASPEGVD